jgi:hypothetical protein
MSKFSLLSPYTALLSIIYNHSLYRKILKSIFLIKGQYESVYETHHQEAGRLPAWFPRRSRKTFHVSLPYCPVSTCFFAGSCPSLQYLRTMATLNPKRSAASGMVMILPPQVRELYDLILWRFRATLKLSALNFAEPLAWFRHRPYRLAVQAVNIPPWVETHGLKKIKSSGFNPAGGHCHRKLEIASVIIGSCRSRGLTFTPPLL